MPRVKQNIPANENESQRFVRVANHRVNTILTSFKQLGTLGGSSYKSVPEQRKKIKDALQTALDRAMQGMEKTDGIQEFKL